MNEKQIQALVIGDVVTDAFIKLLDDQAYVEERDNQKKLIMSFGSKVPFESSKIVEGVGNAANAAVAFARLGISSGLVSNVGDDTWGRDIIGTLKKQNVDTRYIHINPGKVSNYHYVLWYKEERTILIKHEEYDYQWPHLRSNDIPEWVYFSSISENAIDDYHDKVADWLEENPSVKLAFQPGTFQMSAGLDKLKRIYQRTECLILNREEAVNVFQGDYHNLYDLFDKMHQVGVKTAIITDGPDGAYASDGTNKYKMPIYPDIAPPFERTGAGDAFASTLVGALINGCDLKEALRWAPVNSMSVVQKVGAQEGLLSQSQIKDYLAQAPEWYYPENF